MAVFCSKQIVVPVRGKMLSDYAEGEIVKLNENGSPVEFYVAKHDYESDLNGTGRTLLLRKDGYGSYQWHNPNNNAYATSAIDSWLNGSYKGLLDAEVQAAIDATKFYYIPGNGTTSITILSRSVFMLSALELDGASGMYSPNAGEGTVLPIASVLRPMNFNGSAVNQWTRSPFVPTTTTVLFIDTSGRVSGYTTSNYSYSRPCFTLPGTSLFDPNTNLFKG